MHSPCMLGRMDRDKACRWEAFQPQPNPLIPWIAENQRHPKCANFRLEATTSACSTQSQVDVKLHTEAPFDLLLEALPSVDDFFSILRSCKEAKSSACVQRVYANMCEKGLQDHAPLGNYLISVLVACGCKSKALDVFNKIGVRNQDSWTSLIHDAVESSNLQHALSLFQQSTEDPVILSAHTIVTLLEACSALKCLNLGYNLHTQAIRYGFYSNNAYLRSSLVELYSKCGALIDSQALIDKHQACDVVAFTALMAGYVQSGCGVEALNCLAQMQKESLSPNVVTFVYSLKACVIVGSIDIGQQIHTKIVKEGWEGNPFIGSCLVVLYAESGLLLDAQGVFDGLPGRDEVTWTALIGGYVKHGYGEEALRCLDKMEEDGVSLNAVTFMFGLKACSAIGAIKSFWKLHTEVAKVGVECYMVVANTLVDSYAKWGFLADACVVFHDLPVKDVASWNALILGYSEQGLGEEALKCFHNMKAEGVHQDFVTFVNSLKACGGIRDIQEGRELHVEIVKKGFETNLCVGSAVLDMYIKCEFLEEAWEAFFSLPVRDVITWTSLVEGCAELELPEEALDCMQHMQQEGISPNPHTYASGLKACKWSGVSSSGHTIHAALVKSGFDEDLVLCNNLVDMYSSSGAFFEAEAVFDRIPFPNDVSWNALMGGYGDYGLNDSVLDCLGTMQQEGFVLNAATSVLALKACSSLGDIDKGQDIHAEVVKEKLEMNPFVNSSLVNMYSKCGFLEEAIDVFSRLPYQDVVAWTALIAGLVEGGFGEEALTYLEQMQLAGVPPEVTSFVYGLKACGNIQALDRGRSLHTEIIKEEQEGDTFLRSSLIDMYARCGLMSHAQDVFDDSPTKDVVVWTSLLAGYCRNGLAQEALSYLDRMRLEVSPNAVTFICSLTACGNIQALERGQKIHSEAAAKGLDKNLAKYLIEMYAKCGSLEEAKEVFDGLVIRDPVCWAPLMAGCAKQGNGLEALRLLEQMQSEGVFMESDTWISILQACVASRTPDVCHKLHTLSMIGGHEKNTFVRRALADMYAECGLFAEIKESSILLSRIPSFSG